LRFAYTFLRTCLLIVSRHRYTFFATVLAYLVALSLAQPDGGFVKFKQATGYFCTLYDGFDLFLFFVVAALGGALGALFNHIVEFLNHHRECVTAPHQFHPALPNAFL
jgi:hypothetical protein